MERRKVIVVGSGPAAYAAVLGLLHSGARRVTVIDIGFSLEPAGVALKARLRQEVERGSVSHTTLSALRHSVRASRAGVPEKTAFGSRFSHRRPAAERENIRNNFDSQPSGALGGFSNIWGASIMPYRTDEMGDWPIPRSALDFAFSQIAQAVPHSMREDGLAHDFPLSGSFGRLQSSAQASGLLGDLQHAAPELRERGISFGHARLAVNAASCRLCGFCLYGCPFDSIFETGSRILALAKQGRIEYVPGRTVVRFREEDTKVELDVVLAEGDLPETWTADRVILAAGALGTTRLVLESLRAYDRAFRLSDSQYFLFPFLRYRNVAGVEHEQLHSLSQAYVEINNPAIALRNVHLQFYGYSDLVGSTIRKTLGPLAPLFASALVGRMMVVQGYLHSHESSGVTVRLRGAGSPLELAGGDGRAVKATVGRVLRELLRQRGRLKGLPVLPLLKIGAPGFGNHFGGAFPMHQKPTTWQTNTLGVLDGLRRVHIVDSSIFPSFPANTVTWTVMANAFRIAALVRGRSV